MANINRVVLVGNLTRDPELRHTPSGTAVCSLRIAVNTRRKDGATGEWTEKPNYFDITVWGNQGESCAQYLAKGRPVAIDGRLEWREWEAQDGTKRQAVEVVADSVQFLGGKSHGAGGAGGGAHPVVSAAAGVIATGIGSADGARTSRGRRERRPARRGRERRARLCAELSASTRPGRGRDAGAPEGGREARRDACPQRGEDRRRGARDRRAAREQGDPLRRKRGPDRLAVRLGDPDESRPPPRGPPED